MPELPEVESVRRQLAPELPGRAVVAVWRDPYPSARITDVELAVGHVVEAVERRGKYLVCPLVGGDDTQLELVLHLGMTGSLRFTAIPSATLLPAADAEVVTHVRVRFDLDDGRSLIFRDPRRFGRVSVVAAGDYVGVPTLASLGPEPLSEDFDASTFAARLAATDAPVKARLLDQRLVAGVGNIYADEALWRARIHPASRRVGAKRAHALHRALIEVLTEAVEREGTTFRDYRTLEGRRGGYGSHLAAYGRAELPCERCGTPLRRTTVAQRGTTYCPRCQKH